MMVLSSIFFQSFNLNLIQKVSTVFTQKILLFSLFQNPLNRLIKKFQNKLFFSLLEMLYLKIYSVVMMSKFKFQFFLFSLLTLNETTFQIAYCYILNNFRQLQLQ